MRVAKSSETGFTLLEVLVVVFIIGLTAGLIVMNLPVRASNLQEEAAQLRRNVKVLTDRAILTGVPHALELESNAYRALQWQAGDWQELQNVSRELAGNVQLQVPRTRRGEEPVRIVFDPIGIPGEGELELQEAGQRVQVSLADLSDGLNR